MVRFSQCLSLPGRCFVAGAQSFSLQAIPSTSTRMRQFRQLLLASVVTTSACASGPEIRKLGDYPAVQPLFTTPQNEKTPSEITVNLARPSYVSALYVVPGRGAVIVYPTDTTMDTHLDAGAHTIPVRFSERPYNRDSALAMARRVAQGRARGGMPAPRTPVDTLSRDSSRVRGDSSRLGGFRDPSPGSSPIGYLLLVASPAQIPLQNLQRRVNGITIPIDDDEALSTVMKLVKSTLPDGTTLAGYARELDRT